MNDLFIKACYREKTERTPVWIMRQAGRYLPEYRAVRKKYDFITMYKTPEVAAEVTLQPIDIIDVDAAILFSDILVVPEAMGMELQFVEGKGPMFPNPVRSESDLNNLRVVEPDVHLKYMMDAIKICRRELTGRVPLIGFCGAPWTLATYMIEGQGSKNFTQIKKWRFGGKEILHKLLKQITEGVTACVKAQVSAGAQVIQIFDTWAGILDPEGFKQFALPYANQIFKAVKQTGVPRIYFAKGAGIWLDTMLECSADVLGLDWTVDISQVRKRAGDKFALQGNLDPTTLYAPPQTIREQVQLTLEKFGYGNGHIFNLGHGILPDIPVENVKAFVDAVKDESKRFHL